MDYDTLKFIWWALIGVLLIGVALFDGFDMGSMLLMPFAGKTDSERRAIINTIGPHWDGNQVWLITAGGAIFAAWPLVYAAAFSGFYWAMLLVLFALFLRPVGFEYRSKIDQLRWRSVCDWGLFTGSLVPALVFGVAFGNLLQGVPFHFDADMRLFYTGSFWALLNPFALLVGVVSVSMLVAHGGGWLSLRTEGDIADRVRRYAMMAAIVHFVSFQLAGLWMLFGLHGFSITSTIDPAAVLTPLAKTVAQDNAGWQANFSRWPILWMHPLLGLAGSVMALTGLRVRLAPLAFAGSSMAIIGTIVSAGVAMFPFILPSSSDPASSLTAWDAVSSRHTLAIMLGVAAVFVPLVLGYTVWSYWKLWGKVTPQQVDDNPHMLY